QQASDHDRLDDSAHSVNPHNWERRRRRNGSQEKRSNGERTEEIAFIQSRAGGCRPEAGGALRGVGGGAHAHRSLASLCTSVRSPLLRYSCETVAPSSSVSTTLT